MTARCRNCTHHKLYMQPSSSGYSAQSSLVGTRLVTENMRTSLSTTCTKTWREGTRYETHKSLEVGNFLGCVNIVKAFRPLSGKVSRVHTNKTHDIKQEAQDGKKKVILRVMHNKKPTTLGFVSAWLSESFFSSCLVLPVCPLLRGCFQFSRTVDSTAAPSWWQERHAPQKTLKSQTGWYKRRNSKTIRAEVWSTWSSRVPNESPVERWKTNRMTVSAHEGSILLAAARCTAESYWKNGNETWNQKGGEWKTKQVSVNMLRLTSDG